MSRRIDDRLALVGHSFHKPGSISIFAVDDIDADNDRNVVIINTRSRARDSVDAAEVRPFIRD